MRIIKRIIRRGIPSRTIFGAVLAAEGVERAIWVIQSGRWVKGLQVEMGRPQY